MSAKTIRDALDAVFFKVRPTLTLIKGEPDAIQVTPALYTLLDDFDVEDTDRAELQAVRWRFMHRLVLSYQVNEVAEDQLMELVDALLDAVQADPKLSGLLHHNGQASIRAGSPGFTEIPPGSDKVYRTCDLESEVLEVTKHA